MPPSRKNPPVKPRKPRKACDGTAQDYRRHSAAGEEPCQASREAWRLAHRHYNVTGVYAERNPDEAHPFFYTKTAVKRKRKARRNGA